MSAQMKSRRLRALLAVGVLVGAACFVGLSFDRSQRLAGICDYRPPAGIVTVYQEGLTSAPGVLEVPEKRWVATLRDFVVHIYEIRDNRLEHVFSQEGQYWDEIESFPGYGRFPGIILWSGEESSRTGATVVSYVNGSFKVVFEGHEVTFADLDFDGVAEIVGMRADARGRHAVWRWDGQKFASAGTVLRRGTGRTK